MTDTRLFLFGIGGTGSRIIKAFTFLLAAGLKIKVSKVIPIIIDPDRENGDLTRTLEILKNYQSVRSKIELTKNGFFGTELLTLNSLEQDEAGHNYKLSEGFKFDINRTKEGKFKDFIAYEQLSDINKKFISLLFPDKNLNAELEVGFKGNPNMGSVVLNQFKDSDDFRYFASNYRPGDRIFIISSIFGGTGAAGFPLLVKNIRDPEISDLPNPEYLKNAPIGAITVLPYFGVEEDTDSEISKGTFISKTKAALSYYQRSVNNLLNSLYYVGDTYTKDYPNSEGKAAQKNDAHFVELIAALAIVDFLNIKKDELENQNGVVMKTHFKEFGLNGQDTQINFKNFGTGSRKMIIKPLSQYLFCCKYWNEQLRDSLGVQAWSKGKGSWFTKGIPITKEFPENSFFRDHLKKFNQRYLEWLREMARNQRTFKPFNTDVGDKLLHNMVTGYEQKQWDYSTFDGALNQVELSIKEMDEIQKFMAIFYQASDKIFNKQLSKLIK